MKTDELEKLLAEATPGPWNARSPSIPDYYGSIIGRGAVETGWPVVGDVCLRTESGSSEANAHLIAMAPDLAADKIRLERENERLRRALEEIVEPTAAMEDRLEDGERLDELMAIALAHDAGYLKGIARAALEGRE